MSIMSTMDYMQRFGEDDETLERKDETLDSSGHTIQGQFQLNELGVKGLSDECCEASTASQNAERIDKDNAFPVDCLPRYLREFVCQIAYAIQVPLEMVATCLLAALSIAAHGMFDVKVKELWKQPVCLYLAVVAESGERKTPVMSILLGPINEYEMRLNESQMEEHIRSKKEKELARKKLDIIEKAYTKGKATMVEYHAARKEYENCKIVPLRHYCVSDTTTEKLGILLEENNEVMAVAADEGGTIDNMLGRYNGKPNLDLANNAYDRTKVSICRVTRDDNYLAAPTLTMLFMVQPCKLKMLMSGGVLESGFSGRFLYAWPPAMVGNRKCIDATITADVSSAYKACIDSLLAIDNEKPLCLSFSEAAKEILRKYEETIEPDLASDGKYGNMNGFASKHLGKVVRIAALLHLAEHANEGAAIVNIFISEHTTASAIRIGTYYLEEGEYIWNKYATEHRLDVADRIWDKIKMKELCGKTITKEEFTKISRNLAKTAKERDAVLNNLLRKGYIKIEKGEKPQNGGNPTTIIRIAPFDNTVEYVTHFRKPGSPIYENELPF